MFIAGANSLIKNTSYKVVLPFYIYAAISFLMATIMVYTNVPSFTAHYFNPAVLAITHIMALGWGTMIILGASHQLFPVMIEGKLHSNRLAYASFILASIGIPLLVITFYNLDMGVVAKIGGILINLALISYVINIWLSIVKSKSRNVHAVFAFTSVIWLLTTTLLGLVLLWNFNSNFLSAHSLYFLSLHAHIGIIGWFLILIIGVGSRLIPMFLISKYENFKQLWLIYALINGGLLLFIVLFFSNVNSGYYTIPVLIGAVGVLLFANYIYKSYQKRIRKKVDAQVKISMLSVALILVPIIVLCGVIFMLANVDNLQLLLLYGFTIFFGWITAIILGMTFKTLPFIVWNKRFSKMAGLGKTPNPKDLFNNRVFLINAIAFLLGFISFGIGIIQSDILILKIGAFLLIICAVLYNFNVFKILFYKSNQNEYKN